MKPTRIGELPRAGALRRGDVSQPRRFDLLRWFSIASLVAVLPVAAATGAILSHFIAEQALHRDALFTTAFIRNCIAAESSVFGGNTLASHLDARVDPSLAGMERAAVMRARGEFFEHLEVLPGALVVNVYAPDRTIVWSTNAALVGTVPQHDEELDEAFDSRRDVARHHSGLATARHPMQFQVQPKNQFVETYVPLEDVRGQVAAVVEVYKDPGDLTSSIRSGQVLAWITTMAGAAVVYLGLFSIVRRGNRLLQEQQRQLVEANAQLFAGELATALAHSLRNPLSSVRNSAELAMCSEDLSVRKNAEDIITQVDFLAQWIRELLLYSRPLDGQTEMVDLKALLHSVLASFAPTFERLGIRVRWDREAWTRALVPGNTSLFRQAIHSVISNAVEAMPAGGEMWIQARETNDPQGIELTVTDTGIGMSSQQLDAAFRPFHTTKAHGLGIGLPMLHRAMKRFGGSVTLASVPSAGTEVRLHFRIQEAT